MKLTYGKPPNFEQIAAVFPKARERGTIFTYGDTVFVDSHPPHLSVPLVAHEAVHCERQKAYGINEWWTLYLASVLFRYDEELRAHRAEWGAVRGMTKDRETRARALRAIAQRLASPLYGNMVGLVEAKQAISA